MTAAWTYGTEERAKGKQIASNNTQAPQAVGRPADQLESPKGTHTLDFPPLPDSPLATGTMEQGRTQAEMSNSIDALLTAVAGLLASQQSQRYHEIEPQRGQINALIEELRKSPAPSTTPDLKDTELPLNLPSLPESPPATGKMGQGRTQAEGTMSKSIDTLSTTAVGLTTSQQSQRYEIEAQEGQINAPIDELRKPRALSTTPQSPPNRDYDLHEVEDVITPPLGPKFHTVKDTAGTFTLSASLLRVQALQCSMPSRFDKNITPISIPLQISAQGGVRSENTAPKAKITFPKRSGRLPEPMAYTDTDWGGSLTWSRHSVSGYAFKIVGGPISWCSHRQTTPGISGYYQDCWYRHQESRMFS